MVQPAPAKVWKRLAPMSSIDGGHQLITIGELEFGHDRYSSTVRNIGSAPLNRPIAGAKAQGAKLFWGQPAAPS